MPRDMTKPNELIERLQPTIIELTKPDEFKDRAAGTWSARNVGDIAVRVTYDKGTYTVDLQIPADEGLTYEQLDMLMLRSAPDKFRPAVVRPSNSGAIFLVQFLDVASPPAEGFPRLSTF